MIPKEFIRANPPQIPFDLECVLRHAEQLVVWEEPLRALQVLNNLPAYFRDHEPKEVKDLRHWILKKIHTAQDYMHTTYDDLRDREQNIFALHNMARGLLIKDTLTEANKNGIVPHIVDFGPGEYWMALGLMQMNLQFTYKPIAMQNRVYQEVKTLLGSHWVTEDVTDRPNWFVAYEIIEHLKDEWEIAQEAARCTLKPEKIFLSTPRYIYDMGDRGLRYRWREPEHGLGHLRCYTPNEFLSTAIKMFPEYTFVYYDNPVMCLRGELHA